MIASPPQNKPVVIDFTSGFNSNLLFSRASTATRTNKNGNIESVLSGIPRIDFNAITGESRGALIEPQRTNYLKQSSGFSDATWTKAGCSIGATSVLSPDGSSMMSKIVESSTLATHEIRQNSSITSPAVCTVSCYAKQMERRYLRIAGFPFSGWSRFPDATFDLLTGAVVSSATEASIEHVGGGIFRCSVQGTAQQASVGATLSLSTSSSPIYQGDGSSGICVWGTQIEVGETASSYIATTTAQVTRAADSLSIQGAVFNRFFTQSEGAIYVEFEHSRAAWPSPTPVVMCISDGTGTGEASGIVLSASAAGTSLDVSSSSVSQASLLVSSGSAAGVHRAAFSYKADSFSLSANNATPAADTAGTIPTLSRLDIGSVIGARHFSGWIRRIAIFPRAASSAIIQSITQ